MPLLVYRMPFFLSSRTWYLRYSKFLSRRNFSHIIIVSPVSNKNLSPSFIYSSNSLVPFLAKLLEIRVHSNHTTSASHSLYYAHSYQAFVFTLLLKYILFVSLVTSTQSNPMVSSELATFQTSHLLVESLPPWEAFFIAIWHPCLRRVSEKRFWHTRVPHFFFYLTGSFSI